MSFLTENYRSRFSNFKIAKAEIGGLKRVHFENIIPFTGNYGIKGNGDLKSIHHQVVVFN